MDAEQILNKLNENQYNYDKKQIKYVNKIKRVLARVLSFADECEECKRNLPVLCELIEKLLMRQYDLTTKTQLDRQIKDLIVHLHTKHNLIPENYYTEKYTNIGMLMGIPLV
jgi:hypothetical protein